MRLIRNTSINTSTPSSGDIVKFENVTIQNGANIIVEVNNRFEAIGTFDAPIGATIEIKP